MSDLQRAVETVVGPCLGIRAGEDVVIVVDRTTESLGAALREAAARLGAEPVVTVMEPREVDGQEPPAAVAAALAAARVFIAPTHRSLSHTRARKAASDAGARGATLPGVTEDMLARLMACDFPAMAARSRRVAELLSGADEAHVTCPRGSDMTFDLHGREGIADDGDLSGDGAFGNLPCGEGFISPLAGAGTLHAASLAGLGLPDAPVELTVRDGRLTEASGEFGARWTAVMDAAGAGGPQPRRARRRHERARDPDRQHPRGREDARHRPRRLRGERRDRRHGRRAGAPGLPGGGRDARRRRHARARRRALRAVSRLVAVPNVSEGRDEGVLDAIGDAFARHADVLDRSADPDHHRAVFFLAAAPGQLHRALAAGAAEAAARIDLREHDGMHPRVGALDVAPVVFLEDEQRGGAIAEALLAADAIGAEGIPVFLYGELAGGRTRAELRKGGPDGLSARGTVPDYGPAQLHPTAGATLVAARPPLIAFNLELAPPATLEDARRVAALIRAGGAEGLPGVRALGLRLERRDVIQVSTNVEDHRAVTTTDVLAAVARHHPVKRAELVAPAPQAALAGWPDDVELRMPAAIEALLGR